MVRFYFLYDGDDLQSEKNIISYQVIKPLTQIVEKKGYQIEFKEFFLNLHDDGYDTKFDRQWLKSVCEDESNESTPHFVLLVGDRCGFDSQSNINEFKMLNFVDYIKQINEMAHLTILISKTDYPKNQHELNNEYKSMLSLCFVQNSFTYSRTNNPRYLYQDKENARAQLSFGSNLLQYLFNSIDFLVSDVTYKIDNLYDTQSVEKYVESKSKKDEFTSSLNKFSPKECDYALSNAILLESFIFEHRKNLKYFIEMSGYTYRHWRGSYTHFKNTNPELCVPIFENIGRFICENLENEKIKRLLYHSTFFACMAIEFAYSTSQKEIAEKIIYLGYDRYFELETLYIMKKYDEELFYKEIKEIKKICFRRNVYRYFKGYFPPGYEVFGQEFCSEFLTLAKQMIKEIKASPDDDPRKNDAHVVPDWAE